MATRSRAEAEPIPPPVPRRLVDDRSAQSTSSSLGAAGGPSTSSSPPRGETADHLRSHNSVLDAETCDFALRGAGGASGGAFLAFTAAGPGAGAEALRKDLLAFYDRREDSLADLIIHLSDGQAVLANAAVVEARLPALLSAAEPLLDTDPAMVVDDCDRRTGSVRQVRVRGLGRPTLEALLRWAYGEAVPRVGDEELVGEGQQEGTVSLSCAFDLLEACGHYELERLGVLLREAMLESLDVGRFAAVLRESHVRHIPGLKQGCMRFALHHFDELVEKPEVFVSPLQALPEVVSDLFRLSRRWKDEIADARAQEGRSGSPRPAPAPPSSFIGDLARLFEAARLEEEKGKACNSSGREEEKSGESCVNSDGREDLCPDCRIAVGEDIYLGHSVILAARSDFFQAAFTSEMAERASLMVSLQHVRGDPPRRESVLALLDFMYTGRTSRVTSSNAMEVLALIGGEQADDSGDRGGYLQLHDAATLRSACEAAAESVVKEEDGFLTLLAQAHLLGAWRLKARAMRLAVHHFKDLALKGAFEALPPQLLTEVLKEVATEFDRLLPSAAKGLRWELSLLPLADSRLENTYEAVSSPDLSRGAGASGTAGCSEASLVATFDRPVRVRRLRIGADLTSGLDATRLNGSKLQYLSPNGAWQDGLSVSVEEGLVREIELPQILVAKSFRLVRRQRLAVGMLAFE